MGKTELTVFHLHIVVEKIPNLVVLEHILVYFTNPTLFFLSRSRKHYLSLFLDFFLPVLALTAQFEDAPMVPDDVEWRGELNFGEGNGLGGLSDSAHMN